MSNVQKPATKKAPAKVTAVAKAPVKAAAARKAVLKGTNGRKTRKIRTSVIFRRPVTLHLPRNPKYQRRSTARHTQLLPLTVLKHPVTSETAMKKIEEENTLVFITDVRANKYQIKAAIKESFNIEVEKINTLIQPDGKKKAYIRLAADVDAMDVANRIGYI